MLEAHIVIYTVLIFLEAFKPKGVGAESLSGEGRSTKRSQAPVFIQSLVDS